MNTMNTTHTQHFSTVLRGAGRFAMQWRLLLLWLAGLSIPAALTTFPVWRILANSLDHSVNAANLAQRLDINSFVDLQNAVNASGLAVVVGGFAGIIVTLLLSPLLSGAVITAAKSSERLSFGQLFGGGLTEYGRMLRLLLWAIVPLGIACGIGAGVMHWADKFAEKAILESNANLAGNAALALFVVLFFVADATLDAGRAQFALSSKRRSAIKAWWRGLKLMCKKPLSSLGLYSVLTVVGLLLAAILGVARINMPQVGAGGFVAALLVTQLMVAATAWMRGARLFALIQLSKANQSAV
jgi:hypothetical protein